jgi:DNA-binding transcriptional ArsR family regulator
MTNTANGTDLTRFAPLGMFFEAADPALFPLGRHVEVMAMGSWYRGVVVKAITPRRSRITVRYTAGSGETRDKAVSLSQTVKVCPFGRRRADNPCLGALGVRIPAALADVAPEQIEEAKAEKVAQATVTEEQVMGALKEFDHERTVRRAGALVRGHARGDTWADWSGEVEPSQIARRLDVAVKTHGASIRKVLKRLEKAGKVRVQLHGRNRAYSAQLNAEQGEAELEAVTEAALVHEPTAEQIAQLGDLKDRWLGRGAYKGARSKGAYEELEALGATVRGEAEEAARNAGKRYLWVVEGRFTRTDGKVITQFLSGAADLDAEASA